MALKAMSDLLRWHSGRDLRLAILQPGGGQCDCISLIEGHFEHTRVLWNLNGTSLVIHGDSTLSGASLQWPALLGSEATAAAVIESALGWRRCEAGESAAAVSVAVLAELAARYALSVTHLHLACGWHDSSDGSAGVEEWAEKLPQARLRLTKVGEDWRKQACVAARFWAIEGSESRVPIVVVDLSTGNVLNPMGQVLWSIADEFRIGAGIRAMAWRLETNWRSGSG